MTLQERLVSEAREKDRLWIGNTYGTFLSEFPHQKKQLYFTMEEVLKIRDQIILHTIEQTIKEGIEVLPKRKVENATSHVETYDNFITRNSECIGYNQALTDTQHALRGIIK